MKTNNILGIAVIVILLLAGAYFVLHRQNAAPTVTGTGTTTINGQTLPAPQKLTMTSGVSVQYYADTYGLAVNGSQLPKTVVPPCEQGFDYCLYRIGTEYANTNFESAGIGILIRTDLKNESACLTTKPDGFTNLVATTTKGDGYSSSAFGPLTDAAAGHYSGGAQYRLWTGTTCTQFTTRIGETQIANYPPGTKTELTTKDLGNIKAELNSLLFDVQLNGKQMKLPGV